MDTQTLPVTFFKVRTLAGRLSEAMKFISDNFKLFFKLSAYILVPLAVIEGIFSVYFMKVTALTTGYWIALGFMTVVMFIGSCLFYALVFTLLQKYRELGYLPAYHWEEIKHLLPENAKKLLKVFITFFFFYLLFTGIMVLSAVVSPYLMIVAFLLFIFLIIPLVFLPYVYIFEGKGIMHSLRQSFKIGIPYWGSTFVVILIMGVLAAIVQVVVALPWMIGWFAAGFSKMALMQGEIARLPGFFPYLMFVLGAIVIYVSYLSALLMAVPMAYQYGSIKTEREEKEAAEML